MTIVRIDEIHFNDSLKIIKKKYDLFGPKKNKTYYEFKKLKEDEIPDLQFDNSKISPKGIIFPQSEIILHCDKKNNGVFSELKTNKNNDKKKAIIGIRPCDAKANQILDLNFDNKEYQDPYWKKAYNDTTFIGLACNNPSTTCFCTSVECGPYNTDGLDILLVLRKEKQYLAKIITKKGENFAKNASWKESPIKNELDILKDYKIKANNKISSKIKYDNLKDINLLKLHSASFWEDIAFSCLNCGICTFSCPTCWCFDIQDESYKKDIVRMKNWDSCMFPIFTLHTTGHNPRKTKVQRLRQRFLHKLKYFIDKYDMGIMCVGCGRCISSCPVNIDIRKICKIMNDFQKK